LFLTPLLILLMMGDCFWSFVLKFWQLKSVWILVFVLSIVCFLKGVKAARARALWNAGYRSVRAIASAKVSFILSLFCHFIILY
jgi:hypothetical protein